MNKVRVRKLQLSSKCQHLLHFGNRAWLDWAFVYPLESTTIGIAGQEMPEWNEIACLTEKIFLKKIDEKVILQIPDKFN